MNRKSYWSIHALIISTLIFSTVAFLTSCSSSSTKMTPPPPVVAITATSGGGQSAVVGAPFTNPLTATVTTGGTPTSGVTVTFTSPAAEPNGTFAGGVATATATTNSSGVATSPAFTAGTTAGTYTVTASAPGATATASFSLTNTAGAAANLAATSGGGQSATVSAAFANPLAATVTDSDGNGVMGVSVTFIAPASSGASGLFADGGTPAATDTVMTDASGKATSTTFTANATAGGPYNVVASSTGLASVNFSLTNVPVTTTALAPGNYVFSLTGADANGSCTVAGVFTLNGVGAITGGEQDLSDFNVYAHDNITSGAVAASVDGNLIITLNTGDTSVGVSGTETLDATLVSSSKALITEFDTSASSSGELDLQATGLTTPAGGFAFFLLGLDSGANPLAVGGVLNVDNSGGAGGISGTGSVFDINDNGAPLAKQSFTASTVTAPDALGLVTFTLNNSVAGVGEITLVGYMVDASHIRLVENYTVDVLAGTTGGTALGQGASTGGFTTSSIEGKSLVFGTVGYDFVTGGLDVAGIVTANADGTTVGGNLSFNDTATQNAQGGTAITGGTYTVDSTGRVTATGVTDGATFTYNLQIYLDGNGNGLVISMDAADVLAGPGAGQTSGSFTAASFSGNYALDFTTLVPSGGFLFEQDGVGTVAADGVGKLTGFLDVNESNGAQVADLAVSNSTFAVTATNGVFTGTIADPVTPTNSDLFTYYLIDSTSVVAIENDASQLTLGLFELQ